MLTQPRPINDALRYILLNTSMGPNLAATRDAPSSLRLPLSAVLLGDSLSLRKDRCTLVWWDGVRLKALGSARMRAGSRAWEVERIHIPRRSGARTETSGVTAFDPGDGASGFGPRDRADEVARLLEGLTQHAGSRGAERVMLRLPAGSDMIRIAQRSGFFPYFEETQLCGRGGSGREGNSGRSRRLETTSLRPRVPHEEYAVFQLYSACTPGPVRSGLAMTFEQWRDSRSRGHGVREEVYERDGKIRAWLALGPSGSSPWGYGLRRQATQVELMVHPDDGEMLPVLLDYALARKGAQTWIVPEYQGLLKNLLVHRGFEEVAHYSVLIKTTAAKVGVSSLASVEARPW